MLAALESTHGVNNIPLLPWPLLSPDMVLIGHAWDELGRRVSVKHTTHTVASLRQALVREWTQMPQAFFQRLLYSIQHHFQACSNANGAQTRY